MTIEQRHQKRRSRFRRACDEAGALVESQIFHRQQSKSAGLQAQTSDLSRMSAADSGHLSQVTHHSDLLCKSAVAQSEALMPEYQRIIEAIPPEAGFGGIWESEMFLFYAAVKPFAPKQILESGRARGKSTLILARCFPESRIISVEYERESENTAAAETKLKNESNVDLLYGDSREILPERLQIGDAVLIDGPKDFRALRLAVDLLQTRKPCAVFVHDFPPNSPQRKFVEQNFSNAFFGDDRLFDRFQSLDAARDPRPSPQRRYGIFVCLPPPLPKLNWSARFRLRFSD